MWKKAERIREKTCIQPNARYGSSDPFRLGRRARAFFFYAHAAATIADNGWRQPFKQARRMPQWLGWILRL
jgi:hypothetical protein